MTTPPSMADFQAQYTQKLAAYDTLVQTALATNDTSKIPELQTKNAELNDILEKMLNEVHTVPTSIQIQREELVSTLNRIQREYNGLKDSSDELTLLRRIREGETGASRKEFQFYLGIFFALCLGILAMIFFGGQMTLATAMSAPTPNSTAPLA